MGGVATTPLSPGPAATAWGGRVGRGVFPALRVVLAAGAVVAAGAAVVAAPAAAVVLDAAAVVAAGAGVAVLSPQAARASAKIRINTRVRLSFFPIVETPSSNSEAI